MRIQVSTEAMAHANSSDEDGLITTLPIAVIDSRTGREDKP